MRDGPARLPGSSIVLLLALFVAAPCAGAGSPPQRVTPGERQSRALLQKGDVPIAEWREGPVRYLLTFEEARAFRALASDAERTRFIERFWARRDPEPATLLNEFRLEFWKRVADSRRLFTDSSKPGWKTDMGRIYILLGPPDDRDTTFEQQSPGLSRTGIRSAVTWRYTRSPAPHIGTGLVVAFTRDPSGEFRLETDPRIVQRLADGTYLREDPRGEMTPMAMDAVPEKLTEIGLLLDLGRLEEVPTEEDLLSFIVSAEEYAGVIPFGARYDFFAATGEETLVALTLSLHPDPLGPDRAGAPPDYLIVGRIDPRGGTEEGDGEHAPSFFLREQQFQPGPRNAEPEFHGPYVYQAWVRLRPGRYQVTFAAFDRVARRIGSISEEFEVPSYAPGRLALSSLCLSDSIEQLGPDDDRQVPYVIGNLKVMPRLIPTYRNGDTFAVYYQIYSAATDPQTLTPALKIAYQFYVEQPGGFIPIGRPIPFDSVGNSAQAWSFPLKAWPAADFKLQVTVTDTLSGQTASREVAFRVQ